MPNENPIKLDAPGEETSYSIEKKYTDTIIFLTLKVELLASGWLFASAHSIFLSGKDIYPSKMPEPIDLPLNHGNELHGKKFSIRSHISRFREGGGPKVPKVLYTLIIKAGDRLLDEFKMESDINNPSNFNSLIRFKLES